MGSVASCQSTLPTNVSPRVLPQDTQLPSTSTTDRSRHSSCRQRNRYTLTMDWPRIAESSHLSRLPNALKGNDSPVSKPIEKVIDKHLVSETLTRIEVRSLPCGKSPASAEGRKKLNSDNGRRMILSDESPRSGGFQNILSPIEVEASSRAEAKAKRRNYKKGCWHLGFGAEWNVEPDKPDTWQTLQGREDLDDTFGNFNHTPPRRRNGISSLLGFVENNHA